MKCLLLNKSGVIQYSLPYFWASAKTYYEENSEYASQWEWLYPWIDYSSVDSIVNYISNTKPDIIGFSVYMWNESLFNQVAKQIRQLFPNITIIFGGPQCDIKYNENYFREKPYVDLVAPGDAYGEIIWRQILDSISINGYLNPSEVCYSYYPDTNYNVIYNSTPIDKKGFKWPKNVFASQHNHLVDYLKTAEKPVWGLIETSRGCPYKCSFCDWGGGVYTKVNKKDFGIVLGELEWLAKNQADHLYITDANFGLFDIDIEYIKHTIRLKKKYGFPTRVVIQATKTKIDNLRKIYELLSENDMMFHYRIAVEDINQEVLKNVDRVDFSFEEKTKMCLELQAKNYYPIVLEGILGLPGSSLKMVLNDINVIISNKLIYPLSHSWILLPETPAYAPDYREKFKLETVKNKDYSSFPIPVVIKDGFESDTGVLYNVDSDQITTEYVVSTMSYTKEEWAQMYIVQNMVTATYNTGILNPIADYLHKTHNVSYGDFFFWITELLVFNQNSVLQNLKDAVDSWLFNDAINIYVEYREDFPYRIFPSNYISFMMLTESQSIFKLIADEIFNRTNDTAIHDLCHFCKNRLLTLEYDVNFGRKFTCEYDWSKYIDTGELSKVVTTYTITDQEVHIGGKVLPIDWQQYSGVSQLTHFFYRLCYDSKGTKTATTLSVDNY